MKALSIILLIGTTLQLSCFALKHKDKLDYPENKQICGQYRVTVKLCDIRNGDTIPSNSWNPGYNGWDFGKTIPDSIMIVISVESAPLDFENNKPFDMSFDLSLLLKGGQTWDCMNIENPIYSQQKVIVENKEILCSDFFSGEHVFENLKKVEFSFIVNLKEFLIETYKSYGKTGSIFILNALVFKIQISEAVNTSNQCVIEHYHPVCVESTNTIFNQGE